MAMRRTTLLLLASLLAIVIFWMGFIMGEEIKRRDIIQALKDNDTKAALFMWHELKEGGVDVTKHPLFFLSFAKSFAKKGNMDAVNFNLNKAIELLGAK